MPTTAPKPKSTYKPAPQGTHMARLYQMVQIGTVREEYLGKLSEFNKIRLSFELPLETKVWKEGEPAKPVSIHKEYTFSMGSKANLRKLIEGIIGTTLTDIEAYAFDVESLIGQACLITIKHKTSEKGNVRDEIASASPLMKGQECPAQFNPSNILTFNSWSEEKFEKLPGFIREKIMETPEYKGRVTESDAVAIKSMRNTENAQKVDREFDETGGDINPSDIPF